MSIFSHDNTQCKSLETRLLKMSRLFIVHNNVLPINSVGCITLNAGAPQLPDNCTLNPTTGGGQTVKLGGDDAFLSANV
jgi:hypothetical protein